MCAEVLGGSGSASCLQERRTDESSAQVSWRVIRFLAEWPCCFPDFGGVRSTWFPEQRGIGARAAVHFGSDGVGSFASRAERPLRSRSWTSRGGTRLSGPSVAAAVQHHAGSSLRSWIRRAGFALRVFGTGRRVRLPGCLARPVSGSTRVLPVDPLQRSLVGASVRGDSRPRGAGRYDLVVPGHGNG